MKNVLKISFILALIFSLLYTLYELYKNYHLIKDFSDLTLYIQVFVLMFVATFSMTVFVLYYVRKLVIFLKERKEKANQEESLSEE